jgi:catechol 2,3-dioxygenase-like lactoylglutathione lyase family enzyme
MRPTNITANLSVGDLAEARDFYVDFLGLRVEAFNLGWVANLQSPDGRAVVQLVTREATSPVDSVHPLTTEPWGVRRFFVRAPDGNVVNIVSHVDD